MRVFLLLLLLILAAPPATAAPPAGPRMLDAAESEPWKGVGRVNIATVDRRAMCTGTLIAPDLVLTAAHCVVDRESRDTFAPGNVHFVAGWHKGRMAAHRKAAAIAIHPQYRQPPNGGSRLARDLAVIRLESAIDPDSVPSFPVGRDVPATELTLISYRRDRAHALTRQDGCTVIDDREAVMLLACEAIEGVSGSPLFDGEGAQARVVGVVSAMGRVQGRDVVMATEVGTVLADLVSALP